MSMFAAMFNYCFSYWRMYLNAKTWQRIQDFVKNGGVVEAR